jgi:hypothetical protein
MIEKTEPLFHKIYEKINQEKEEVFKLISIAREID